MNFPGKYVNHSNVCIYCPATIFMASKRVTDLSSAKPKLLPEPNFSARKSVFWKVVNFPSHFFPQWKWYFRSNYDWKFSFLIPDGISGKKSIILRILREYQQILQLHHNCVCTMLCGIFCYEGFSKRQTQETRKNWYDTAEKSLKNRTNL